MGFPSVLLCVHRDLVDGRCVEHERMWVATNTTKSNSFFVPSTPSKSWTLYSYKEHSGWHNRSYSRVFRCGWQPPFGPNTLSKPTVVSRNDFESEAVETWRGMVIVHQSCREACGRECLVAVSNTRFFLLGFLQNRSKSGHSHNTGYKTRARTNRLGQSTTISDKKIAAKMKQCMGLF